MFEFLTRPGFPKAAIGIEHNAVSALELRGEGRGRVGVQRASTIEMPKNVVRPAFTERNIQSFGEFRSCLEETVVAAGLAGQRKWSVALPSNTARTAIITLDPERSRKQSDDIFEWKAEQIFGAPASQLRINKFQISPDSEGKQRFFAAAVKLSVMDEYESVFEGLGWKTGLILPRAVAESQWLNTGAATGSDSLLISSQEDGFTAVLLRGKEPAVIRSVTCELGEVDDEIYRLLMFYNDRFTGGPGRASLDRLLLVGRSLIPERIRAISTEAFGRAVAILRPDDVGLSLPVGSLSFDDLAAPGALASFGFR